MAEDSKTATGQSFTEMTLENLCHGGAAMLWQDALQAVLEDIDNPNNDAKVARSVSLTLTIKPTESRNAADMHVKIGKKLAGHRGIKGAFLMGREKGKLQAYQGDARQMDIVHPSDAVKAEKLENEETEN